MTIELHAEAEDRARLGIPPLPLNASQVEALVDRLLGDEPTEAAVRLLAERVPPGVDPAARVKAGFLAALARGDSRCAAIGPVEAVRLLGTMSGGYNVAPLVELLERPDLAEAAGAALSRTLLVFDAFHDVADLAAGGNAAAAAVLRAWAGAEWFTVRPQVPEELPVVVFRVRGEINTDDLSPAPQAWSRADIPLHARSLLSDRADVAGAVAEIARLRSDGRRVAFVGDVVGTGSSRKSAVNSLLWHIGDDIDFVPNKRRGGIVIAQKIAPIFLSTLRDAGALALLADVDALATGDELVVRPHQGRIERADGSALGGVALGSEGLLDEVRAGGRLALVTGRTLADRARQATGSRLRPVLAAPVSAAAGGPFTLAQKIVGRACGTDGVGPGVYCEPTVSSVASQDTTGPMNRAELEELACLGFGADLVLQSFCHTAAYPKPVDIETHRTLPAFMEDRGGVALRPGDGIIHSWLNRMLLPDQVGTGSDSHTRFPLGLSFPAGSGLVAFAAALGVMPVDMPESVLVRFCGEPRPGITRRDLVNAIPFVARQQGHLTLDPATKRNVFNGRIIEIEGLEDLSVEQAFELTDSTAERSAAGCTISLSQPSVERHLRSNLEVLRSLIDQGYEDRRSLERRVSAMEDWLREPELLRADPDARYAATIEIDVAAITEPLLAFPNDPDDVRPLSEAAGTRVDEVFIGSCMTNVGHFRAAGRLFGLATEPAAARVWMAPPTRMDEAELRDEGLYSAYASAGARTEIPGCSLCMGNQARVAPGSTVVSTSTRNFPNRMGRGADVYLASAELAAVVALQGRVPTMEEYLQLWSLASSDPAVLTSK